MTDSPEEGINIFSGLSREVIKCIQPKIASFWKELRNPAEVDCEQSIKYWKGLDDSSLGGRTYTGGVEPQNVSIAQFVEYIKTITDPKKRFLSATTFFPILVTDEGPVKTLGDEASLKTVRLCFPHGEKFHECYFPWKDAKGASILSRQDQYQYSAAQYALIDINWETLVEPKPRSLMGAILHAGEPRVILNLWEERQGGPSIRPEVDNDIGFGSLVFVPIEQKLWLLVFSPLVHWFSQASGQRLCELITTRLKREMPFIRLAYDAILAWEDESKRLARSTYKRLIFLLTHTPQFRKDVNPLLKTTFDQNLWEEKSLGDILSNYEAAIQDFGLVTETNAVIEEITLKSSLKRLGTEFIFPNTEVRVQGDPAYLRHILGELIVNASQHASTLKLSIDSDPDEKIGRLVLKSDNKHPLSERDYFLLRSGMPQSRSGKSDESLGMWLVSDLTKRAGGFLRVSLQRTPHQSNKITDFRKGLEISVCFPIAP